MEKSIEDIEGVINFKEPPEKFIVLHEEDDGNWKGYMKKNGKIIVERQYEPHSVIDLLITHD
jgi:hypothetical protein